MRRSLLLPVVAATAVTAPAQQAILPAAAATGVPPTLNALGDWTTFAPLPTRVQHVWDHGEIPIGFAVWTALQFRAPGNGTAIGPYGNPPATFPISVTLSNGPSAFQSPSPVFANNLGTNATKVYSGPLSLPAVTVPPLANPQPWTPPIVFGATYFFDKARGTSFVVDVMAAIGGARHWSLEAWRSASPGAYGANLAPQPGCRFGTGGYQNLVQLDPYPFPGQPWSVGYGGLPPGTVGVAALGALGAGARWNGLLLPLDLTVVGAPGCSLAVSIDVTLPLLADAEGVAKVPAVPIPPSPQVDGQAFFDQGLFLDARANALGIVTGASGAWRVGGPRSGTRVWTGVNAHTAAAGTVELKYATAMRLY